MGACTIIRMRTNPIPQIRSRDFWATTIVLALPFSTGKRRTNTRNLCNGICLQQRCKSSHRVAEPQSGREKCERLVLCSGFGCACDAGCPLDDRTPLFLFLKSHAVDICQSDSRLYGLHLFATGTGLYRSFTVAQCFGQH